MSCAPINYFLWYFISRAVLVDMQINTFFPPCGGNLPGEKICKALQFFDIEGKRLILRLLYGSSLIPKLLSSFFKMMLYKLCPMM